jgi:hypothetical protein
MLSEQGPVPEEFTEDLVEKLEEKGVKGMWEDLAEDLNRKFKLFEQYKMQAEKAEQYRMQAEKAEQYRTESELYRQQIAQMQAELAMYRARA